MTLNLKLQAKLTQQLVLTPQLQLSIKVLQLNHLELKESIDLELQENPTLEQKEIKQDKESIDDAEFEKFMEGFSRMNREFAAKERFSSAGTRQDDDENVWESFVTKKPDLCSHLLWQLHLENFSPVEISIGEEIIGNIDPDGYLRLPVEEIADIVGATAGEAEKVLKRIQQFDPVGIASRDLRECLLNQVLVFESENPHVHTLVENYLDDLSRRNLKKIAKEMNISLVEVENALHLINSLNPKPGNSYEFSAYESQEIEPDVYVAKDGDDYFVTLNFEGLPHLKINKQYEMMFKDKTTDPKTREFLQEKLKSALWFIKSIQQRGSTIRRVAEAIVQRQKEFFEQGPSRMKPLTLRDLAEQLGLHESTISRVTSNKYMLTPSGLFEMKYFFSSGIRKVGSEDVASLSVKELIRDLVNAEDHQSPLSDQDISDMLKAKGYSIARRTVTKYRESMSILASGLRKK